jgi:hypothetical protein
MFDHPVLTSEIIIESYSHISFEPGETYYFNGKPAYLVEFTGIPYMKNKIKFTYKFAVVIE